ncbi:hypothetical protein DFH08DRAFT_963071 [Mycena albidolilacea]|uniref:Uncharacterized protein n=1 Tax=Mycena albidolilacea TaxID=1033008 RepID=A0AAD7ENG9_9AGAR|nr:hypothetical protein DFH08DRAFT_963071 [Mycena albidolilacea]
MSTILAFSSTVLFSWGVRRSVTLRLRKDDMPLATFVSFVKISSRSFIFDFKKPTFTLTAIVIIILTGEQTAGWSALITPRAIVIKTPLIGHEIDFSSPLLRQMPNNAAVTDCIVNGTSRAPFIVGQTDSGYAAVKGDLSLPVTFNVMDYCKHSIVILGGILPLTLSPLNSSTWFPGTKTLPPTIKPVCDLPYSLTSSYPLFRQGFTADVYCGFWNSTDPTIPIVHLQNDTVGSWQHPNVGAANVSFATLYSNCTAEVPRFHNWTGAYTLTTRRNYILMIACPSHDNLSYKLVFDAGRTGLYGSAGTTVCSLSPKITNVSVTYSDVIDTATNGVAADISGPRDFFRKVDGSTFTHNITLRTTEKYIRGVTEYSGSVFRACLSTNTDFLDALPSNKNVSTSGMFRSETVGWVTVAAVTILELLLGTIGNRTAEGEYFDPADVMHLVAAAAAGGLNSVFVGTEEEHIRAAEDVHVSLGTTAGRGAASVVNRGPI